MLRIALLAPALLYMASGAHMLFAPEHWYSTVPGVTATGPYNRHFVIDIGFAFAASGAVLASGAIRADGRLALAGTLWPCLHALFHLQIWFARGLPLDAVGLTNWAGIQLPAWLSLLAGRRLASRQEDPAK